MFLGARFYLMLANNFVGSLVSELVSQHLSYDIMHVIYSHQIDAQVKWIYKILMDIEPYENLLNYLFKNIYTKNEFTSSLPIVKNNLSKNNFRNSFQYEFTYMYNFLCY
jgi:hypothetical protein